VKLHREFSDEALVPSSKAVTIAWNQPKDKAAV